MAHRGVKRGMLSITFLLLCFAAPALAQTVVFDQGPTTGTSLHEGWTNQTTWQNFADVATLAEATQVTAVSIYNNVAPSGDTLHVKILADNGGVPGALLYSEDKAADSWVADAAAQGYRISVVLTTPFTAQAGVPYWYGISSASNFTQYSVRNPGDGQMAQFDGPSYSFMAGVGDQMFQLEGVPAPPVPALGAWGCAALALLLIAAGMIVRRKRIA